MSPTPTWQSTLPIWAAPDAAKLEKARSRRGTRLESSGSRHAAELISEGAPPLRAAASLTARNRPSRNSAALTELPH